ncbi:MAG: type I-MYXAN CRISPR-associated Cas8a1/Cmx1 [Proteobacteria bacterium]|nr:type I-MYXAN CRISPR-associated Cas8a1/Cmx1 [Pseudomonadota bacterium]
MTWELSPTSVRLWWQGDDLPVLQTLMEWAWQNREGVYYLPGVHRTSDEREHFWKRLITHTGLLQTFFQHNLVMPREKPSFQLITVDEGTFFSVAFQKLKGDLPQLKQLKEKFNKGIDSVKTISMPSWIYPGAAKRFGAQAKEEQNWTGPAKIAFLLLFAPIACTFFELPQTHGKANWLFLAPEIKDLQSFAENFNLVWEGSYQDFLSVKVQGLGDAGLRFACAYAGRKIEKQLQADKIYIVAMGRVGYYQGQNVRKLILPLTPSRTSIKRYALLMKHLPNTFKVLKKTAEEENGPEATHWIRRPTARGRIAENLVQQQAWYLNLHQPTSWQVDALENQRKKQQDNISLDRLWFQNLERERRAIMDLANEEAMWDSPEEQAFVAIFQQTLRNLLNRENEALSRGGSRTLWDRWEDRVENIRRDLMRAKTRELNRKFVVEFLAAGGGNKLLTQQKEVLWHFLNHPFDWKKARDLALVALVTFTDKRLAKPEAKEEVATHE